MKVLFEKLRYDEMPVLTAKQGDEITEEVGKMLVMELDKDSTMKKVEKVLADYVKKNKIDVKPDALAKNIKWSVKVSIKA